MISLSINLPDRAKMDLVLPASQHATALATINRTLPNDQNTRLVLLHASFSQVVVGPMNMQA